VKVEVGLFLNSIFNPTFGFFVHIKNVKKLNVKVEVGLKFKIQFLTQHLGFCPYLTQMG